MNILQETRNLILNGTEKDVDKILALSVGVSRVMGADDELVDYIARMTQRQIEKWKEWRALRSEIQ